MGTATIGNISVYIRQEQYSVLAKLMAACERPTRFPVSAAHADGLYFARRQDLEIVTPACLVLLSHRHYDEAHEQVLGHSNMVKLVNIPDRPGWWRLEQMETLTI